MTSLTRVRLGLSNRMATPTPAAGCRGQGRRLRNPSLKLNTQQTLQQPSSRLHWWDSVRDTFLQKTVWNVSLRLWCCNVTRVLFSIHVEVFLCFKQLMQSIVLLSYLSVRAGIKETLTFSLERYGDGFDMAAVFLRSWRYMVTTVEGSACFWVSPLKYDNCDFDDTKTA